MPLFDRYLGIDYSGAETPTSSLPGLRVYEAFGNQAPAEIQPPPGRRKYWTRRGLAEWLATELRDGPPTLVGIDHAFSFPIRYFEIHHILPEWPVFLDDFCHHWPTDEDTMYVEFIRDGRYGNGAARAGNRLPAGCGTAMQPIPCRDISFPICAPPNAPWPKWKAGFSVSDDPYPDPPL